MSKCGQASSHSHKHKLGELQIREAGLQFTVQSGHEMMAKAYIPRTFFDEYRFESDDDVVRMEISIGSLIETMNIYGTASTAASDTKEQDMSSGTTLLKLSYEGYGYPLALDMCVCSSWKYTLTDSQYRTAHRPRRREHVVAQNDRRVENQRPRRRRRPALR